MLGMILLMLSFAAPFALLPNADPRVQAVLSIVGGLVMYAALAVHDADQAVPYPTKNRKR